MAEAPVLSRDTLAAHPSRGLSGRASVPGDKSISHRALILGALAHGETSIEGLLESLDVMATANALRALGADVERLAEGRWQVAGKPWRSPGQPIDCGNSGTLARLLMGAVAGLPISATFVGDESLSSRPMDRVLDPLIRMGARVTSAAGCRLPVTIEGGRLKGIRYASPIASAQIKSAVLLAGLHAEGEVEVTEPQPSRDHMERMLRDFGCDMEFGPGFARLGRRRALQACKVAIPADPSSAAFSLVAALIVPGSRIVLPQVMTNPLRLGLVETLRQMGADIAVTNQRDEVADLEAGESRLRGLEVPAERAPRMIDEYPILAVAAACADGRTILRGLSELRAKESDRFAAIAEGLTACGVTVETSGDDMIIEGRGGPPPGGAVIEAKADHRIAMSFLVLGLAARAPVTVDSIASIATSFPGFVDTMRQLGATVE